MEIDPNHPPAPSRDPEQARREAKAKQSKVLTAVIGLLAIGFAVKALLRDREDRAMDDALANIVAEQRAQLPRDLGNGFTITAIGHEGRDIEFLIQADTASSEALREAATLARVRDEEQAAMLASCGSLQPFLAAGTVVRRKLVADDGRALFEVRLDRSACGA